MKFQIEEEKWKEKRREVDKKKMLGVLSFFKCISFCVLCDGRMISERNIIW